MKKIYSFVTLVAFSCFSLAQTNLVQNPSFENGLTSWFKGPTSSYTVPLVLEGGYNSSSSVGYISPTGTTGFYQNVPIEPGVTYILSFWYKATGDGTDARIWSFLKDSAGGNIYLWDAVGDDLLRTNDGYLPTAANWTQHSIEFTNTTAVSLQLAIRVYSGSQTAFDEFSLINKSELSVDNYIKTKYTLLANTLATTDLVFAANSKNVQLFNSKGQIVKSFSVSDGSKVNVSSLPRGIYLVIGEVNGEKVSQKVVLK